jgi:hypothetical protein
MINLIILKFNLFEEIKKIIFSDMYKKKNYIFF